MTNEYQKFGNYFLIHKIGAGGMAEVFLAAPTQKERIKKLPPLVALKKILPEFSASRPFVERFVSEAKLSALLNHKNIIQIFDLGAVGTQIYFAMEWVDGKSLDLVLERLKEKQAFMPIPILNTIFRSLLESLHFAHEAKDRSGRPLQIVHQDVTPGNFLIGYDGIAKLSDFGLATAAQAGKTDTKQVAFGKLPYMPPEQIKKESMDRRVDLYSFGVLLFEALTGKRPFDHSNPIELQNLILGTAANLSPLENDEQQSFENIIRSCLEKDPAQRPTDAQTILDQWPIQAPPDTKEVGTWLTKLFELEKKSEVETVQRGLMAWADHKEQGADLGKEDLFADDLLAGSEPAPSHERTEWTPASQVHQATRIHHKKEVSETSLAKSVGKIEVIKKVVERVVEKPDVIEEEVSQARIDADDLFADELLSDSAPATSHEKTEWAPRAAAVVNPVVSSYELANEPQLRAPEPSHDVEPVRLPASPDIPAYVPTPRTISKSKNLIPAHWVWLILIGLIVGISAFLIAPHFNSSPTPVLSGNVRQIQLFITVEKATEKPLDPHSLERWTSVNDRERIWIRPLLAWLQREEKKYGVPKNDWITVEVTDFKTQIAPIDWHRSFFSPFQPFNVFQNLFRLDASKLNGNTGYLFVHLYPKLPEDPPSYPVDFQQDRPPRFGVVFIPLTVREDSDSLIRLAHEVMHAMGAHDRYDKMGRPIFPDGFAHPEKDPVYPQKSGEIMGRFIPVDEQNVKPIRYLEESVIGEKTAREIGWKEPEKTSSTP